MPPVIPQPISQADLHTVGAPNTADPATVGSAVMAAQRAGSSLPSLDQSSAVIQPGAVQNTSIINSRRYTDTIDQLLNRQAFGETPEGVAAMGEVKTKEAAIDVVSPGEQADITAAGKTAESQYTPILSDAELKKKQGLASGLVQAAKSGGLDSSAWVGISALVGVPAGGPEGFLGVGGKLASMASEYDAQINNLKIQQQNAIVAAQDAKKSAIITGKKEDWDRAVKMYNIAKSAFDDGTTMLANKATVLESYNKHLEEQKTTAQAEIKNMAAMGLNVATLSPAYKLQLEDMAGLPQGTFDKAYKQAEDSYMAEVNDKLLERGKSMYDIAKTLQVGQSYTVPGTNPPVTIQGVKQGPDNVTYANITVGGKIFKAAYDADTGKEMWRIDTGETAKIETGKTISWEMAKDLGNLSLYGQPVSNIPAGSTVTTDEEKKFDDEAAMVRGMLAKDEISWAEAYNYMRAKYQVPDPQGSQINILDKVLQRSDFSTRTGASPGKEKLITVPASID